MRIHSLLLGLAISCLSSVAGAETLVACQYTQSKGYKFETGHWNSVNFSVKKPFFLKIKDGGVLDSKAMEGIGFSVQTTTCSKAFGYGIYPDTVSCQDATDFMTFNTSTLEGARASLGGASIPTAEGSRDTVAVALFTCQKI
jgi:hypothetical protein